MRTDFFEREFDMEVCMKIPKLTLMFLACAAALPAFAQNTSDARCGMTNYDRKLNLFTITHAIPGTVNQQCFITVVAKQRWPGGMPDPTRSKFVEGNYEITLSGGGGGGAGGSERVGGGTGGAGAIPTTVVRYLHPGVYRLTIGAGGHGGAPHRGKGGDGAPTSLANAISGRTIAGYPGAESWNGTYPQRFAANHGQTVIVRGQSVGGRGGHDDDIVGYAARGQDGAKLINVAYSGTPGEGGTDLAGHKLVNEVGGGGGGGAGFGHGGKGDSAAEDGTMKTGASSGELGGGGGGGAGGEGVADRGASGGNGFIRIVLKDPPPKAQPAPAPVYVAPPAPARAPYEPERAPRVDRN
jgi:hypothetical protein